MTAGEARACAWKARADAYSGLASVHRLLHDVDALDPDLLAQLRVDAGERVVAAAIDLLFALRSMTPTHMLCLGRCGRLGPWAICPDCYRGDSAIEEAWRRFEAEREPC